MRLAAVELVDQAVRQGVLERPVDVVFATSLLSAADLRAMLPAGLRRVPLVLYMHENQFAYPAGEDRTAVERDDRDVQFGLTNLTSVLAADAVLWNSRWNRDSFLDGLEATLRHAPDLTSSLKLGAVRDRIMQRSAVAWPPVEPPPAEVAAGVAAEGMAGTGGPADGELVGESPPVRVVWPHRWEHDKGPDRLLALAERCTQPLNLRWTLLGQQFRRMPPAMEAFLERFADRIDHAGYEPDRAAYWRRLAACDWVVSTARHEFFGVAVVEAMFAGCLPWLPDELSYPELVPDVARGIRPDAPPGEAHAVRAALAQHLARHLAPARAPEAVGRIDALIEQAVAEAAS